MKTLDARMTIILDVIMLVMVTFCTGATIALAIHNLDTPIFVIFFIHSFLCVFLMHLAAKDLYRSIKGIHKDCTKQYRRYVCNSCSRYFGDSPEQLHRCSMRHF